MNRRAGVRSGTRWHGKHPWSILPREKERELDMVRDQNYLERKTARRKGGRDPIYLDLTRLRYRGGEELA